MLHDLDIVRLCSAIYDPDYKEWDELWIGDGPDGIYAGLKDNALIFRGSVTKDDWLRDLLAYPNYLEDHPQLGRIHAGFYEGMDVFFDKASSFLREGAVIGGHSLGAARAWLFAGRCVAAGYRPSRISVYGSPRPGCAELRELLASIPMMSYKNRFDPVTNVPIWLPNFPVVDMCDFSMLNVSPALNDIEVFADHHIGLYVNGIEGIGNVTQANG